VPALAPASLAKLALAGAWWESGLPEPTLSCGPEVRRVPSLRLPVPPALRDRRIALADMLVHSCTSAAVELADALASRRGPAALPAALAPLLAPDALAPHGPDGTAFAATPGVDWRLQAAGVGPLATTPLAVARYLHAVASAGMGATPWTDAGGAPRGQPVRLLSPRTARRLRAVLRDTVRRGTAAAAATAGAGEGWSLAGKTGTTIATDGGLDGWFAGLVEAEDGEAEAVVVVWLRGAGPGGGGATELAAELASELRR
jgi:membrane peptidoglycan carboxypeptidase